MTKEPGPAPDEAGQEQTVAARRPRNTPPARRNDAEASTLRERVPLANAAPGEDEGQGPHARSRSSRTGVTDAALLEVMLAEEATRARGFGAVSAPLAAIMALVLPLLGGDPTAKWVCVASLIVMGIASGLLAWVAGHSDLRLRHDRRVYRAYGLLLVGGVLTVEYYFGFFSPVVIVLVFGAYYFGQSHDRVQSQLLPVLVTVTYALMAALTVAGVIDDCGLFSASSASVGSKLFAISAVCLMMTATLQLARVSRRALREAIVRSNEALLVAQRREALLAEAHFQLDRALALGVDKPGRYTGELAGDYELDVVIGIGAVGEVYRGQHRDGSLAAVKLLQAGALGREDLVERIVREGSIASGLDNPHLVKVLGAGRLRDGAPYLAMELLRGRDLAARLRQDGQLGLVDLLDLARQVADGLHHAHAAGIVHRDLKPLNIFEAEQGDGTRRWKILDFGISKLSSSSGTLTQEGVIGTPGYMSPEQARGAVVDARSDLFSLAVVLYRAVTGQPAFPGENTPQILFDIVYKMPKQPSAVAKGLSSEVDQVMMIALAKSPEDRFAGAQELSAALHDAASGTLSAALRERSALLARRFPWGASVNGRG
ncbi:MAG TPA: protein kinase [Polyangiales bacterium]|nr:protein kinase [Polyangiales bacterium]